MQSNLPFSLPCRVAVLRFIQQGMKVTHQLIRTGRVQRVRFGGTLMTQQKEIRKQRDADYLFRLASERYLNGEYEEAMVYLQDAVTVSPDFSSAFCLMGHCSEKQGLEEDAIEQYTQAIVADPYHAEAWYCKGEVLNRLGRTEEGEEHIGKAVALSFGR